MRVYLIIQQTEQLTWLHNALKKVERLLKFLYLYNMKVQFTDNGEIIEVQSFKEIVDYMRESAPFLEVDNNHEYMLGYAQRAVVTKNEDIRATSEDDFVNDLVDKGHLLILET